MAEKKFNKKKDLKIWISWNTIINLDYQVILKPIFQFLKILMISSTKVILEQSDLNNIKCSDINF